MPVIYTDELKNIRLQAVVDRIGAGGQLVLGTSDLDATVDPLVGVLARVPFDTPAFIVANAAMTANNVPRTVFAEATGIAAKVEIRDASDVLIFDGLTLGTIGSGAEVIINALEISTGQTVQITLGTINHG